LALCILDSGYAVIQKIFYLFHIQGSNLGEVKSFFVWRDYKKRDVLNMKSKNWDYEMKNETS